MNPSGVRESRKHVAGGVDLSDDLSRVVWGVVLSSALAGGVADGQRSSSFVRAQRVFRCCGISSPPFVGVMAGATLAPSIILRSPPVAD